MKIAVILAVCLVVWAILDILFDIHFFRIVPYRIRTEKVHKSFRFVVLSDLHNKRFGKNNERLVKKIKELSPDAVLVAGDLVTAKERKSTKPAAVLMEQLSKEFPVYYGLGNHEDRLKRRPDLYGSLYADYMDRLSKCKIRPLINEDVFLERYGIRIYGLLLDKQYYRRFKNVPMPASYLTKELGKRDAEHYSILIAHNPDYFDDYSVWGADLVLSGHNHGGIIRIPLLGGMVSPKCTLFPKYDGGRFEKGDSVMLLSRGLGTHTLPVRILNRAELLYVTIEPEK